MSDTGELSSDNALPAHLPRTALNAGLSYAALGRILDHNLGAIVSLIDLDARLHYVNARFARSFNMTPADMIGKTLFELYTKEHTDAFMPYIQRAFTGEEVSYERLGPVVGSAGIWHTIAVIPWRDDSGRIIGAATSSMRVHELKVKVEALRVANERLSSHFDNSPLTVLEFDGALQVTRCSAQVEALLGMAPEPLIGRSLLPVLGDDRQLRPLADAFSRLQRGIEKSNRVEVTLTHRNGAPVYSEWFNSALTDANGHVGSMMSLVQDVTTRTIAELQLRKFATHDPLTGLYNRRALTDRLEQAVARRKRNGSLIALLFLDLDEFKRVNDQHGHGAGDEVLCEVARRLLAITREADVVSRFGGDEFVVLTETDVTLQSMNALAQRILRSLEHPCNFGGGRAKVGASIGVALCPESIGHARELIQWADGAMYEAKRSGKGRVCQATVPDE